MFVVARYLYNKHCFNLTLIKSQRPTLYVAVAEYPCACANGRWSPSVIVHNILYIITTIMYTHYIINPMESNFIFTAFISRFWRTFDPVKRFQQRN